MIKRLILLTLSALLLFCGCAEELGDNSEYKALLEEYTQSLNSQTAASADYMLEITADGAAVYFITGSAAWDREKELLSKTFSRTHLGYSVEMSHYFDGETLTVTENGIERSVKPQGISPMEQFPCMEIFSAEENAVITAGENIQGQTYSFTLGNTRELSYSIFGGDISSLMVVMNSPLTEKTRYSDTVCTYTVADGRILSCRYEYDVTLYDAPATDDEAGTEEELSVHVSAKIAFTNFGSNVKVENNATADEG